MAVSDEENLSKIDTFELERKARDELQDQLNAYFDKAKKIGI
jgi:hypothetical protein